MWNGWYGSQAEVNAQGNYPRIPPIAILTGEEFTVTHTKLYVHAVTLAKQGNSKPLKQLEWCFKTTMNSKNLQKVSGLLY